MSLAPAHIAGSTHHPDGVLKGLKVVGAFVGDDEWCANKLVDTIRRRLAPLDMIDRIVDGEHIKNTEQLKRGLLTRVASTIPAFWMGVMRPEVTGCAIAALARINRSLDALYNFDGTPADRAALALTTDWIQQKYALHGLCCSHSCIIIMGT